MSAAPNSSGIRRVVLLLVLCLVSRSEAQVLDLGGLPLPDRVGLGDTLTVGLQVHTAGRQLTSVGLALQFDPAVLQPLGEPFDLDPQFFPQAVVYENAITPGTTSSVARARLVAVAPTAGGGTRQVMVGDGLLATADFLVVGFGDSADVHIVTDGGDRPLYTELGRPGVQGGFNALDSGRIRVALDASGFLALPNVQAAAGRTVALGLRGRTASAPVIWRVQSHTPALLQTWVLGDSLLLQAPPRTEGIRQVDYEAVDASGHAVGVGSLQVTVTAAPALLRDPGVTLTEDFGTRRYGLQDFLVSARLDTALTWDVSAAEPVVAHIDAGELVLAAPPDWWGLAQVTLRLPSGRDVLDSLQLDIPVTAINDVPQLRLPDTALAAIVGTRSVGPALSDWFSDVDDDTSDLRIDLVGNGVEAWQADGRLQLRGLRPGAATVAVRVTDPSGASADGTVLVNVADAGQAPVLTVPTDMRLSPGQRLSLALQDLIADADAQSFGNLSITASATGSVLVQVDADSLILTATETGIATVQLSVTDEDANVAAAVWQIGVVPATEPAPDNGLPLPSDEIDPSVPPSDLVADASAPFAFARMMPLQVVAGTEARLDVAASIEPAGSGQAYSVAGATFVDVEIDAATGVLRVLAPPATSGREVLLLSAVGAQGQLTATTLEVLVVDDVSTDALRLLQLPDMRLDGDTSASIELDAFAEGARGEVTWSVTTTDDLLAAVIDGHLLRLTSGSVGGQHALLITATDEGGRRASELLRVYVSARAGSEPGEDLRIDAPAAVALSPGAQQVLDLGTLIVGDGAVHWSIADSAGLTFELSGDTLTMRAAADAAAGWRELSLQAMTDNGAVAVRLSVAISALPALSLRPTQPLTVIAGRSWVLHLDSLVTIGDPQAVQWTVDGGVLLVTTLRDDSELTIDASWAVPGREVLQITASLDGDIRRQSVAVVVQAPQVTVQAPDTLDLVGVEAAVLLDAWVQGDLAGTQLLWRVDSAPEDITAHWDAASRRLQLSGTGAGTVSLQATLASGLQVGTLALIVRLAPAALEQVAPPPIEPEDSTWALMSPALGTLAAGDTLRLPLRDLVDADVSQQLNWQVRSDDGAVRIADSMLELSGYGDFHLILEAWHHQHPEQVQRLQMSVPVQPAPVPQVQLTWGLEAGGAQLRVAADVDADVALDMMVFVDGHQVSTEAAASGAGLALHLPHGAAHIQVVASGRRHGATSKDTLELRGGWLTAGEHLSSPDGPLTVSLPVGLSAPLGLVWRSTEHGAQLARIGAAVPLLLQATHTGEPWATLQQQTSSGWQDIPGVRCTDAGVRAYTDAASAVVSYRARRGDSSTQQSVVAATDDVGEAFPNPFNASVTLPVNAAATALRIYDATGRLVRTFAIQGAGSVHWDGRDHAGRRVASGSYFYRLRLPQGMQQGTGTAHTGRLTLLR